MSSYGYQNIESETEIEIYSSFYFILLFALPYFVVVFPRINIFCKENLYPKFRLNGIRMYM